MSSTTASLACGSSVCITATDSPASPKQIKFLLDLARQNSYTVEQLKSRFNVSALEDLSRTQCSRAIDLLNGKAA